MLNYIIRRVLYAIPILIGVNLITFTLFFVVNTPDDMARMQLGIKRVTPEAIAKWKQERGYDQPLMFNNAEDGLGKFTRTIFFEKSVAMFAFQHAALSPRAVQEATQVQTVLCLVESGLGVALVPSVSARFGMAVSPSAGAVACRALTSARAAFGSSGDSPRAAAAMAFSRSSGSTSLSR